MKKFLTNIFTFFYSVLFPVAIILFVIASIFSPVLGPLISPGTSFLSPSYCILIFSVLILTVYFWYKLASNASDSNLLKQQQLLKEKADKIASLENRISILNKQIDDYLNQRKQIAADDAARLQELERRDMDLRLRESMIENAEQQSELRLNNTLSKVAEKKAEIDRIVHESSQQYPWLAKLYSDYYYIKDQKDSDYLRCKSRPAEKSAELVSLHAKEKRDLREQLKLYEYQLNYYESIFPILDEFKKLDPIQGFSFINSKDEDKDYARVWLSEEEYNTRAPSERNQLALDRWKNRKKTDWEAGIEYERYVGYIYEEKGYKVQYFGATEKLEDMGRDLIAFKDNRVLVIQCKRWSKEKTIHEKHIFQLYGSTVLMSLQAPNQEVIGVFITSAALSDLARECAEYLEITIKERFSIKEYPLIKCNISREGNKIYHLPFDQQYDRVIIEPEKGEYYAWTVKEAEDKGFRRAYKWFGV